MLPPAPPSRLIPPGTTTEVVAERVLVLAPHFDDELLGCGGLLRRLQQAGTEIEVAFLTDSGGGVEAARGDADASATPPPGARRSEAEAVASLAGWRWRCLGLPDGGLAPRLGELADRIADLLREVRPDLLLVPGPLEATPDHRASFDAVFDVLHSVREGTELSSVADGLRVWLYEINHPAYPQILVDVTEVQDWLAEAIQLYTSQLEMHGYLGAALGLRRYRAHTLSPEVEAAEGYTELRLVDFQTHSRSTLSASLGQPQAFETQPAASVTLIVRTCDRLDLLSEALRSVTAQQTPPSEVLVVNDGGTDPTKRVHEVLPAAKVLQHADNRGRAAAANTGIAAASADWVAFLDDDDLLYPEHFTTLTSAVAAANVRVVYSDAAVVRYRVKGAQEQDARDGGGWTPLERRLPYSRDFDAERLLVDNYIPFHTLLIQRDLLDQVGPLDESFDSFEDWDLLVRLAQQCPFHHLRRVTCEYRQFEGSAHHALGGARDDAPSFLDAKARVLQKHGDLLGFGRLASVVSGMRREAVELQLRLDDARARWDGERLARAGIEQDLSQWTDRFHRLNGEVEGLRDDNRRLGEEVDRKAAEERRLHLEEERLRADLERLRADLEQRDDSLRATYGEIERLNELLDAMRSTRAWRLHQLLTRSS